jgi:hypothetical protein
MGILLINNLVKDPLQIYVFNEGWHIATYEERNILAKEIAIIIDVELPVFKWVGYMGNYKNMFDFKIIDTTLPKMTGAILDNKGRTAILKILNDTIEEKTYNNSNTADYKKVHLCIAEELYLRNLDETSGGDPRYFLNKLEVYILNKKLK